jgi:hypothetical protein
MSIPNPTGSTAQGAHIPQSQTVEYRIHISATPRWNYRDSRSGKYRARGDISQGRCCMLVALDSAIVEKRSALFT